MLLGFNPEVSASCFCVIIRAARRNKAVSSLVLSCSDTYFSVCSRFGPSRPEDAELMLIAEKGVLCLEARLSNSNTLHFSLLMAFCAENRPHSALGGGGDGLPDGTAYCMVVRGVTGKISPLRMSSF